MTFIMEQGALQVYVHRPRFGKAGELAVWAEALASVRDTPRMAFVPMLHTPYPEAFGHVSKLYLSSHRLHDTSSITVRRVKIC